MAAAKTDRMPLALRWSWARLIRQVYEVDPLRCPRRGGTMQVIAVIDHEEVISRILSHRNLLAPGDGPRAPPHSGLRELIYEPDFDNLPRPDSAEPLRPPLPAADRPGRPTSARTSPSAGAGTPSERGMPLDFPSRR